MIDRKKLRGRPHIGIDRNRVSVRLCDVHLMRLEEIRKEQRRRSLSDAARVIVETYLDSIPTPEEVQK
jgi:hypothetical protein